MREPAGTRSTRVADRLPALLRNTSGSVGTFRNVAVPKDGTAVSVSYSCVWSGNQRRASRPPVMTSKE